VGHECCGAASAHSGTVAGGFSPSRRTFFQYVAVLAGAFHFLPLPMDFAAGRLRYNTIERVDVPVANLPPELDGLRIAQLSDIHIGDYMPPREIARAVDMANELQPDISFVTGDFVSSEGDPLDVCITELSRLRAPLGVWDAMAITKFMREWKTMPNGSFAKRACGC